MELKCRNYDGFLAGISRFLSFFVFVFFVFQQEIRLSFRPLKKGRFTKLAPNYFDGF